MPSNISEAVSPEQLTELLGAVKELTAWRAAQEQKKQARVAKIFDELNEIIKKNFVTHEEAISILEMMKQQIAGQYVSELNKD
jgi:hypothetical protein